MADDAWMQPPTRPGLTGAEFFVGVDASVADFWRFAMSDLRMNNIRGYLAEFLVAGAIGLGDVRRIEWDAYDLLVDDWIRVEVKSSAYLQAWEQQHLSRIEFSGLRGTRYDPRHGDDPGGRQLNAHVYVFGVQTAKDHDAYNPLDISQWEFYVLSKSDLEEGRIGQSLGLKTLDRLSGGSTLWTELRDRVLEKAEGQTVNSEQWW
jgi:hypothetical protein